MFCLSGSIFKGWKRIPALILLLLPGLVAPVIQAQQEAPSPEQAPYRQDRRTQDRALAILKERGEIVIEFGCEDTGILKHMASFLSIDRHRGELIRAYADRSGFRKFLDYGIPFRIVEPEPVYKSASYSGVFPGTWDVYPSFSQYVEFMSGMAQSHPEICRLDTLGMSVQGLPLLAMKISDSPGDRESEPVFSWSSSMHGDEITGYVLLLHLIDYLVSGYGLDSRVTRLVDSMEIWINPLANPDGTYAPGRDTLTNPKRFNANNVDLNRNFPGLNNPGHPDGHPYQPENIAQMDFLSGIGPAMGANIHGGEEVVNYPFDGWSKPHADSSWYIRTSREYADTARKRAYPLLYMNSLDSGITNGWAWYEVQGSRQDWMNYYNHSREVTLEISLDKIPPPEELPYYWYYNYPSMLRYMEQCLYGIRGRVLDALSGTPLKADVAVPGHDRLHSGISSDSLTGYFDRLIDTGTWDLEFSAPGYETERVNGVRLARDRGSWLNVSLMPWASGTYNGTRDLVSPNPFTEGTEISIPWDGPGRYIILVYDLKGRLVHRADLWYAAQAELVYPLSGANLETGVYLLKLITPAGIRTGKIFRMQWK